MWRTLKLVEKKTGFPQKPQVPAEALRLPVFFGAGETVIAPGIQNAIATRGPSPSAVRPQYVPAPRGD